MILSYSQTTSISLKISYCIHGIMIFELKVLQMHNISIDRLFRNPTDYIRQQHEYYRNAYMKSAL